MNRVQIWFTSLEQRERVMVVIGAIAVVLAVFYYGVWQPLNTGLARARTQVAAEAEMARWMIGLREEAHMLRATGRDGPVKGRNQSILAIIDSTSRARGLADAVRRIQPDNNDEAVVTLDDAQFNKMLYWLHMLRRDYNIYIASLTVTRDIQSGLVQARLKLERRGA